MKFMTRTIATVSLLMLAAVSLAETEARQSLTAQGKDITRGSVTDGKISFDEFEALKTPKTTGGKRQQPAVTNSTGVVSMTGDPNFWFYDADVVLFNDLDRDGYYFGVDLAFDADTSYVAADVYAVLYLSFEYGPWNEYAVTEDFTLLGASGNDEYIVETELVTGYPTGSYDLLIELYDAYDGTYLASYGPEDTSELSLLPLEDSGRDAAVIGETQVVVNSGGGGSLSFLLLAGLLAMRMIFRPHRARLSK